MFLRMQRHASRSDSSSHQFLMRVPRDVASRLRGRLVTLDLPASERDPAVTVSFRLGTFAKCSLRTRDASTADVRRLAVVAHLSKVFEAARRGGVALSQKQIVALSGEVYRRLCKAHDENPGTPEQWAVWKAFTRAALEGRLDPTGEFAPPEMTLRAPSEDAAAVEWFFGEGDLTASVDVVPERTYDETALMMRCGRLTLWVLQEHGIEPDKLTHLALLREVARAALQAGWQLKRQAQGDYRPDPLEGRFPPLQAATGGIKLPDLFDRWRVETKPAASTVTTWRVVIASLQKHLGHDETANITAHDIVAWKDSLISGTMSTRPLSAKTINDTYLSGLRALLNYGVRNKLIMENVATGVKVVAKRKAGTSKLPYASAELARLLTLCAAETHPARRWIPLLLATSGARVGEVAQLWAERITTLDGIAVMKLEPAEDGGSFKNEGSERTIPLHPAVIEAGFLDFVREKRSGPLFYGKNRRRDASRHASKGTANHLAEWIRDQGFTDIRKPPNHAMRHWWKSAASRAGVSDSIADAIQGHADSSSAGNYRHFEVRDFAAAVRKIPVPR